MVKKDQIKILMLAIAIIATPAVLSAGTPKNFDVIVRRNNSYILKNGRRWNWQNEEYAEHIERWFSGYWKNPPVFSFRNGRVLMKKEYKYTSPANTDKFKHWMTFKEVVEGTIRNGVFKGTTTTYSESFTEHYNQTYSLPSGLIAKTWCGGRAEGRINRSGVLVLKQHFDWDRGTHRTWVPIKDGNGRHKGYRFGGWKQIPHYDNPDTYAGVYEIKLPRGYYSKELYTQPNFKISNPNKELEGLPVDEKAATTGGFGGGTSTSDPSDPNSTTTTKPKGKLQTGDVVFASGSRNITTGTTSSRRKSKRKKSTPAQKTKKEKTKRAAKAAGAAAAGSAAAAAGAAAMLGAGGIKKEDVLEGIKDLKGKKGNVKGGKSNIPEELDPYDKWKDEWSKKGWKYDEDNDRFVIQKGAVNDKGEVWMEDPYQPGNTRFIAKDELKWHEQQKASGKVWVENGSMSGWHTPEDVQQQNDHDAFVNSDEFEDEERRKLLQSAKDEADNNPEYLDGLKVTKKHEDIEKQNIRDMMEIDSNTSDRWMEYDEKLGNINNKIKAVKGTCDAVINHGSRLIPGGTLLKNSYNAISKAGESYATHGDAGKAFVDGTIQVGKDMVGDELGKIVKIPTTKKIPSETAITDVIANTFTKKGGKEALKFTLETYKDQTISDNINDAHEKVDTMFGDGNEDETIIKWESKNPDDNEPSADIEPDEPEEIEEPEEQTDYSDQEQEETNNTDDYDNYESSENEYSSTDDEYEENTIQENKDDNTNSSYDEPEDTSTSTSEDDDYSYNSNDDDNDSTPDEYPEDEPEEITEDEYEEPEEPQEDEKNTWEPDEDEDSSYESKDDDNSQDSSGDDSDDDHNSEDESDDYDSEDEDDDDWDFDDDSDEDDDDWDFDDDSDEDDDSNDSDYDDYNNW